MKDRVHFYSNKSLRDILEKVKFIALVGASNKPHRFSYQVMEYLLNYGFRVIPVNPNLADDEILGQKCYPNLLSIPDKIDMVDIFRSSKEALEITKQAIGINPKVIWMQLGVINYEACELAQQSGIKVVMNRCPKIELEQSLI